MRNWGLRRQIGRVRGEYLRVVHRIALGHLLLSVSLLAVQNRRHVADHPILRAKLVASVRS